MTGAGGVTVAAYRLGPRLGMTIWPLLSLTHLPVDRVVSMIGRLVSVSKRIGPVPLAFLCR